jgi:integrase
LEATQLKTNDIDRARVQLRVSDGKGAKSRVLPLSERLLKELENYWRAQGKGKADHDSPCVLKSLLVYCLPFTTGLTDLELSDQRPRQ